MKIYSVLILASFCNIVFSQTEQIEVENLSNQYKNGEFSAETYKKYAEEWRNLISDFGGYPEFPLEEGTSNVKFKNILETNLSKQTNFKRILEWSAINFGSLNNVLQYKDFESGKIIIKGWFDVTHKNEYRNFWGKTKEGLKTTQCYLTFIFTIKDNIIKTENVNVRYKFNMHGYYSSTGYIPDRTIEVSIHNIYPVTNFESSEWKEKLDLLNQTNIKIIRLINDLTNYIKNFNSDYEF